MSKKNNKKFKIVDMWKFIRFILLIILLTFILTVFVFTRNNVYSSVYRAGYLEVEVEKGDTLWIIAKKYMPEGYDIRKMVFEIMEANNMEDGTIYPNEILRVPVKY